MNPDTRQASEHDLYPVWEFSLGDVVYLKLREERLEGMVTGIFIRPNGVTYEVSWGSGQSGGYYAIELTREYGL